MIDWIMSIAETTPFTVGKDLSVEDLAYADDIALLAESPIEAQQFLNKVTEVAGRIGLQDSGPKTKVVSHGYDNSMI